MTRWSLLFLICSFAISSVAIADTEREWFWRLRSDADSVRRTKNDLEERIASSRQQTLDQMGQGMRTITVSLDLGGAYLVNADLANDTLCRVLLCGANLTGADLRGADLTGAILSEEQSLFFECTTPTQFWYADVAGCIFEPVDLPSIASMSTAKGLRSLRWRSSPAALVQLREEFGKLGFKQAEREVVCALRRHDPGFFDKLFLFDLFCEYGSNLSLLVRWVIGLWAACALCYYRFFFTGDGSGIRLIEAIRNRDKHARLWDTFHDDKKESLEFELKYNSSNLVGHWPNPKFAHLDLRLRFIWWALFFSAISAFNIGFRDVNFGRWLRLLTRRDFDLQPYGWVRVISGVQALISVYLVALWILSFVGTPFK